MASKRLPLSCKRDTSQFLQPSRFLTCFLATQSEHGVLDTLLFFSKRHPPIGGRVAH